MPASTSGPGCGVRGVTSCRSALETQRGPPRPSSRSADHSRQPFTIVHFTVGRSQWERVPRDTLSFRETAAGREGIGVLAKSQAPVPSLYLPKANISPISQT